MGETTKHVTPLFMQPNIQDCLLLQTGEHLPKDGCPRVALKGYPYCSCSHELDSFICEFSTKKEKLE